MPNEDGFAYLSGMFPGAIIPVPISKRPPLKYGRGAEEGREEGATLLPDKHKTDRGCSLQEGAGSWSTTRSPELLLQFLTDDCSPDDWQLLLNWTFNK